jgi:hypothetical protein
VKLLLQFGHLCQVDVGYWFTVEINMHGLIELLVDHAKVGFRGRPWWGLIDRLVVGVSASGASMQILNILLINDLI